MPCLWISHTRCSSIKRWSSTKQDKHGSWSNVQVWTRLHCLIQAYKQRKFTVHLWTRASCLCTDLISHDLQQTPTMDRWVLKCSQREECKYCRIVEKYCDSRGQCSGTNHPTSSYGEEAWKNKWQQQDWEVLFYSPQFSRSLFQNKEFLSPIHIGPLVSTLAQPHSHGYFAGALQWGKPLTQDSSGWWVCVRRVLCK